MKTLIFILLFFISISCIQKKYIKQNHILETSELYRICKIKNKKSFFIIYANRNDSIFKIVSSKNKKKSNCEKIKIKREYALDLIKIFPLDSIMGYAIAPNLGIVFTYGEENQIVRTEEKSNFAIYRANNLNGLCIQE